MSEFRNSKNKFEEFDLMALPAESLSPTEIQSSDLLATLKKPMTIIVAMGAIALGCFALMAAFVVLLVGASMYNEPDYSNAGYSQQDYWAVQPNRQQAVSHSRTQGFRGESGMVSGTFDQDNYRNSSIMVDGEVLNFGN